MIESSLIRRILQKVTEEQEQENDGVGHEKGIYRASGIGRCPRAIQYDKLGYEAEKMSPETLVLLKDGEIHEISVRNLFSKVGMVTHINKPISKKFKHNGETFVIAGHTDFVFNDGKGKTVVDVKGIGEWRFTKVKFFPSGFEEYVFQLTAYQHILKIYKGLIAFKNKNTSELKPTECNYDSGTMEKALTIISQVHNGIKNEKLIDRPYEKSDWHCRFCSFRKECWDLPMESKKW